MLLYVTLPGTAAKALLRQAKRVGKWAARKERFVLKVFG